MRANEEQRAYWNRDDSRHWVDEQVHYDEMLEPFGDAVLAAAAIQRTDAVLDIGCGNGATTRRAARAAPDGEALGVDLSEAMIERARELAKAEGLANARFEVADAQTTDFGGAFDCAISRFGVMFFDDPVGAFANIRVGLRDGGRIAFVVWQDRSANEWMAVPALAMLQHVEMPQADPDAPGPFALANIDRLRSIIDDAGFRDVSIDPFTSPVLVGGRGSLEQAVTFMRNTGMSRALLENASAEVQEKAVAAMRDALEPHLTPEGVQLGSATWIVTARR